MKTIGIAGGTGFIGSHLTSLLVRNGYKVIVFTRNPHDTAKQNNITYALLDAAKGVCDIQALHELDGMVNLAGAGVADKRLTEKRKKEIVDSRVAATDFLVAQLKAHASVCKTFVAVSATGFYGVDTQGQAPFAETAPPATDFLGDTCRQWETASQKAGSFLRTVILRVGIVLGKESGAFPKFIQPLSFGTMPVLGNGKQVVSWIEINDLARLLLFAIEHDSISGIFNAVAPNPITQRQLMQTIASVKGGIALPVPVPAFLLKIILGTLGNEVLKSCTVSAEKTLKTGFTFIHPEITGAVSAILSAN